MIKKITKKITIATAATAITLWTIIVTKAVTFAASSELLPDLYSDRGLTPTDAEDNPMFAAVKRYHDLPQNSLQEIMTSAIKIMLYVAGGLATVGLIVVGFMYLTGSINDENINKAKKMLGYIGIGIVIMSISYALIAGIIQINPFAVSDPAQ